MRLLRAVGLCRAFQAGTSSRDLLHVCVETTDGNVVLAGHSEGSVNGTVNERYYDIVAMKLDVTTGQTIWTYQVSRQEFRQRLSSVVPRKCVYLGIMNFTIQTREAGNAGCYDADTMLQTGGELGNVPRELSENERFENFGVHKRGGCAWEIGASKVWSNLEKYMQRVEQAKPQRARR